MIHCIGNSHVNNFSNHEKLSYQSIDSRFKLHHIGPVIAYNFFDNHMGKVNNIIQKINREKDYVTLVVGEVDCRLHLPSQSDSQQKEDEVIVKECADRFFKCYNDLVERGYNVFCIGTHPTTNEGHDMTRSDRPIYGDMNRRNNICLLWDKYLKINSEKLGVPFINIYNFLVDGNNNTKMEYFQDYCHLKSNMIFPTIVSELEKNNIL